MCQLASTFPFMRKEIFRMDRGEAVALLARAPFVHLASSTPEGEPVLRALHAAVVGDHLLFHAAPAGEKMDLLGQRAVIAAEEVVASIPSYFVDPERACPATTFYRSAQAHGVIERIDDPQRKAAMLSALMKKHQPEGGHVPIEAEHLLYRKAIEGVLVFGVALDTIDGKAKLGQNRRPEEIKRILELLWSRGARGDAAAIDRIRAANPRAPVPDFLAAPEGITLACTLGEADADEATALLVDTYWNDVFDAESIRAGLLGSQAWVGAHDHAGALVGTARAISDGAKRAWVYDVIVSSRFRGRGIGRALVRLLLEHPAVRDAATVLLNTRDADTLYASFGFRTRAVRGEGSSRVLEMILERQRAGSGFPSHKSVSPLASDRK